MAERGEWFSRIREQYEGYLETVAELERNRKPGEGIFGLKGGPKDDPCHDRFVEELTRLLSDYKKTEPVSEELSEVLLYIYTMPLDHKELNTAYWMLIASHALTLELADGLCVEDAAALYDRYRECYPRWDRLPVQNKLLSKLKDKKKAAADL